jgi:hypothetical protein
VAAAAVGGFGLGLGPLGTFLRGEASSALAGGGGGGGRGWKLGGNRVRWDSPTTGEWRAANDVDTGIISGRSTSGVAAGGATLLFAVMSTGCSLLPVHSPVSATRLSTVATLLRKFSNNNLTKFFLLTR